MKITNKNAGGLIIKILGILILAWSLSGCDQTAEEFFDLTPAVRTPPLNVSAVPVNAPFSDADIYAADTAAQETAETTAAAAEPDFNNPEPEQLYQSPDTSKFTQYPNMYVDKYTGEYKKEDKTVYLTFDDGPSKYTEAILEVLEENGVKATFFTVPDEGGVCAKRLRAIAEAGHTIGVHSYSHNYCLIYENAQAYVEDFARAYNIIVGATNQKPRIYRFPGGSVNQYNRGCREEIKELLGERGFEYYDWNVDSNDWRGLSVETLCQNVVSDAKKFSSPTILMHDTDTRENTAAALDRIIKELKDCGYKFAAVTETVEPVQYGVNF